MCLSHSRPIPYHPRGGRKTQSEGRGGTEVLKFRASLLSYFLLQIALS